MYNPFHILLTDNIKPANKPNWNADAGKKKRKKKKSLSWNKVQVNTPIFKNPWSLPCLPLIKGDRKNSVFIKKHIDILYNNKKNGNLNTSPKCCALWLIFYDPRNATVPAKSNDSQSQKMQPTFSVHLRHLTTQRTFTFHPTWFSFLSFITHLFIPTKKKWWHRVPSNQGRELKQTMKREPFELRNSSHRVNKLNKFQSTRKPSLSTQHI